ncbi:MAG: glycosyltransferase family 39 protein, partial [archaeon]
MPSKKIIPKKSHKLEYILLTLILIFALFLRLYALGDAPFWIDESISAVKSINILHGQASIWPDDRANLFQYIQAGFLAFSQTDAAARLVSVLFGLLTIFLAFKIGKEYSNSGGIIAALFTAVFYLEVFFSRQARMYQMFQFFFFLTLYLLYKSKEKPNYLYFSLISFFITLNTHLEGLILAPFMIIYILIFNKKQRLWAIVPAIPLVQKAIATLSLSAGDSAIAANYASQYLSYTGNMTYLLILFIPGLVWAFIKNKKLTSLIILPCIFALAGVFSLETFALRYAYFFALPLILYASLLFAFLYDKYGKLILLPIIILLIVPSNIFYHGTYINVLQPTSGTLNDASAPITDYKNLPLDVRAQIMSNDSLLLSYFSSNVEWYLKKPDFVLPFSLDGRGQDQISLNLKDGRIVDRYSEAPI